MSVCADTNRNQEAKLLIGQREAEERRSQRTRLQVENYQLGLEHVRSLTPSEAPSEPAKKWFIWKIVDVDPERCIEEAGSMLRNGQTLSHAPAQVLQMYKNNRVKEFLTSAASDAIFVEAPVEGQEMSRCSSMSLACAVLLQDLSSQSHVAAVHYFCGAHNNAHDPVSGGIGIARILIGQLLCLQEFDLTFLDAEWRTALDYGNPHALFRIFEHLIAQLTVQTLFCVIDGITLFEGNQWKDETVALISELLRLVVDCRHPVHLKILVTSSSRSRLVAPLFREEGLRGLVRLRLDSEDADVSMRAVKLEIARNAPRLSPSPGRSQYSTSSPI